MGREPTKGWVRVGLCLMAAGCMSVCLQAGPWAASPEQARAAIADVQELHMRISASVAPVASEFAEARTTERDGAVGKVRGALVASRADASDALERATADPRAREHAQRSLRRISRHLEQAERRADRDPAYAVHRADLARRDLERTARRLGLQLGEVQ